MSDIEIHHLGAAYVLDALEERERAAYEAHFATCDICRTDVREYRAAAAELASLTATPPPADVKARVMSEIAATRQLSPLPPSVVRLTDRRPNRAVTAVLAIAAAALFFVAGAVVLGDDDESFGDELAAMMEDPTFTIAELGGDAEGSFRVAWTSDELAVIGDGLPDPGRSKRYELWMIDGSGAHAMQMLDPANGGDIQRLMDFSGAPSAWGVTIEDEDGADVPTEPILYQTQV
ncbi:MAG TPA: anti-sigma factor [Ilumatobacter sp.]|jgi:anti-sigma-K factor RskA|nr:anti-sigma factor [Ilumatobacter sp.]